MRGILNEESRGMQQRMEQDTVGILRKSFKNTENIVDKQNPQTYNNPCVVKSVVEATGRRGVAQLG